MLASCMTSPSTAQVMRWSGPGTAPGSSAVTSHGPSGVDDSNVLPWRNWIVRFCQSRADTSLSTEYPAIAAVARVPVAVADRGADDDGQLGLPVDLVRDGRQDDVVVAPISAARYLAKTVGYAGGLAAHLGDVRAVVQPDADDLVRPRDERGVVEVVDGERSPAVAPPGHARRVGEQLADVGGVEQRRRVVVDADGPRAHRRDGPSPASSPAPAIGRCRSVRSGRHVPAELLDGPLPSGRAHRRRQVGVAHERVDGAASAGLERRRCRPRRSARAGR